MNDQGAGPANGGNRGGNGGAGNGVGRNGGSGDGRRGNGGGGGNGRSARPGGLDPVLLEIMRHKVEAIADEICLTLLRSCRSVFVNEAADFAVGLIDLQGEIFGWAPENKTTSVNVPAARTIELMGALEPGDAIVTNDPYSTDAMATHLPDLHVIRPYFDGSRLVAYGWGFIHYMDVGGRFPGSMSPYTSDIFQEGFRIPPMKLMRKGVINEDFVHLFTANCRIPETNMADLRAMLGALEVGGKRVRDTIERYGVETFVASQRALKDYAAEKAREVLRMLPDGVYDFWDYLDDDVVSAIPIRMRLRATVDDGRVHFDVTGTDPQVEASYNIPTAGKLHNMLTRRIMTFICTHDRTIPLNAGTFRPLGMTSPKGTVLNAEFPDACAVRFSTATGFNDAVSGVLLQAVPDAMAGATAGAGFTIVVEETSPEDGRKDVIFAQLARGGMSAWQGSDGVDVRDVTMNTMHNHPLEVAEAKCGLVFREYDVRPDSAGPGRWRGGAGQVLTVEALRDGMTLVIGGLDRLRFPPWGAQGGRHGRPTEVIVDRGRPGERPLGNESSLRLDRGQTLTMLTPGGSGFGDPFARDPAAVRRDAELGFVTRDGARLDYGVVLSDALEVDAAATCAVREGRVRPNIGTDFDFGPERAAWERVFDDATMLALNRGLFALPKALRQKVRRRIVEEAVPDLPRAGYGRLDEVLADADPIRARLHDAMRRAFAEHGVQEAGVQEHGVQEAGLGTSSRSAG